MRSSGIKNIIFNQFTPDLINVYREIIFAALNGSDLTTLTYYVDSASVLTKFKIACHTEVINGLWMSSDELETFYTLFNNGRQLAKLTNVIFNNEEFIIDLDIERFYLCNATQPGETTLQLTISQDSICVQPVMWTVLKGLRYRDWFYLFASDEVFIFAAVKAFNRTPFQVARRSYKQFILCHKTMSCHKITNSDTFKVKSTKSVFPFVKGLFNILNQYHQLRIVFFC